MRMRYWIMTLAAAGCVALNGCNQEAPKPPPDAMTETPILDIDQGTEVAPGELGKKSDAPTPEAGGGPAKGDAGAAPGGK
jgi:hypothetical protein